MRISNRRNNLKSKVELMNKRGFTLAELLIVVAIIAVLVAVAIPVFTSQLEKAREATVIANLRSAYAEASVAYTTENYEGNVTKGSVTAYSVCVEVAHVNIPTYMGAEQLNDASLPFEWDINTPALENDDATVQFYFGTDGTVSAKCKGVQHSG